MLTVTDAARARMADALDQVDDPKPAEACFRIVPKGDGTLALTVDTPSPGDTPYEHDGSVVLVVSDGLHPRCEGRTLDADDTGHLLLT